MIPTYSVPSHIFDLIDPTLMKLAAEYGYRFITQFRDDEIRMLMKDDRSIRFFMVSDSRVKVSDFLRQETHEVPVSDLDQLLRSIL